MTATEFKKDLLIKGLSGRAANILTEYYTSIDDLLNKGAYDLTTRRGCGKKVFEEITQFLVDRGYLKELWQITDIKKDRERLSEFDIQFLKERHIEGLTVEQIAVRHGITRAWAFQLLSRANAKAAKEFIMSKEQENKE